MKSSRPGSLRSRRESRKFPLATFFARRAHSQDAARLLLSTGALIAYRGYASWLPSYLVKASAAQYSQGRRLPRPSQRRRLSWLSVLRLGRRPWGRRVAFIVGHHRSHRRDPHLCLAIPSEAGVCSVFGPVFAFVTYGFLGPIRRIHLRTVSGESAGDRHWRWSSTSGGHVMLSPIIIGALAQGYGLSFGLGATMVFNVLALIAIIFLPETVRAGIERTHFASATVVAAAKH